MNVLNRITDLLFPPKCVLCRRVLERTETDLCRHCRTEVPQAERQRQKLPYLTGSTAVWYYEDTVRESILRFKFSGVRSYAASYGRLLAMKISREYPEGFDLLTWVPISRKRRRKRGYDQGALLAASVGSELEIQPVCTLTKTRDNPPQSGIPDAAKRRANVLGVYRISDPSAIAGKRILLLDDVITTGATAGECARMLLTAGAKEVTCAAVARARHHTNNR